MAASTAALTVYDMLKGSTGRCVSRCALIEKDGGKTGLWTDG